jgi:hypothetical protein
MTHRTILPTLALALCASMATRIAAAADRPFRPPAVPLVANDPYFSIWSFNDKLTDGPTRHWTGKEHPLTCLIRVDGRPHRLMGGDDAIAALPQTSVQVLPTRTIYAFADERVNVTLTFLTPALPDDLDVLARPVTYVTWDVASADGEAHDVSIDFAASPAIAVNTPEQETVISRPGVPELSVVRVGSKEQPLLEKKGDDLRIDWGYLYLAAGVGQGVVQDPVAMRFDLGKVEGSPVSRTLVLAYDDEYSLTYLGKKLRPYWRRDGMDAPKLLQQALSEYPALKQRCEKFDDELMADLRKVGGEKYAQLCALAYRQCFAAHKIVADANGQPLIMSKENFSNGCIATVDVMYPAIPQFLLLSPTLAKASVVPILNYAATDRWKFPFAPHDLGTYPRADGQVYGGGERTEENQMPVEESGNMLILVGAIAKLDGNADFASRWWPQLTQWANYLAEKGFDPENQLCTDDFAGHLAHNVNLSAKAIVALGCYAEMCTMRGEQAEAGKFRALAERFARQWVTAAADGDHTRLAFDRPGTWSQKYNLVWDRLLDLNLFPRAGVDKEIAFYLTKQNRYGLPLDNRKPWAKLDWTVWTATMASKREDFEALTNPLYDFLNGTPDRAPMADWYETASAKKQGFQARSVVGGVFIKMLSDAEAWKKWSSRDVQMKRDWAAAPKPPKIEPIVATARQQPATWRYTFDRPAEGWERSDFDDAAWREGPSGFGDGKTPGGSVNTPWTTPDVWLRRTIDLPADLGEQVQLLVHHDEDVEIYLNGVLAARRTGYLRDYEPLAIRPEARKGMRAGQNLLAVHCRQTRGGQYIDVGMAQVTQSP